MSIRPVPRDGQLALARVNGIDVGHWNPLRRTGRWGGAARWRRPVGNFGDLLGPLIVDSLVRLWSLPTAPAARRLLTVGSIMHFGRIGDVVWGSGVNPKAPVDDVVAAGLDIRCVRGPRSREAVGTSATAVGDPALLLGLLRPELTVPARQRRGTVVVPNLNDLGALTDHRDVVNPRWPLRRVLARIASAELVVGSSLHGVIVAEALGVPARAVPSPAEGVFKYEDHYLATGRDPADCLASTTEEAASLGAAPAPVWDPRPLLATFPLDLWVGGRRSPEPQQVEHIAGAWTASS